MKMLRKNISLIPVVKCSKQSHLASHSEQLGLLFSLKPKEMAKMRLLSIWIDQKYSFKIVKKIL